MAGAGWRQFTVGQLLTSAQVQTYMQDQAVQVHASAAARSSALGTAVSAGMVSYRSDEKALELYAGSAWQPVMQGKNAIINGGFDIWQRGTSVTAASNGVAAADRWYHNVSGSFTASQQTTGVPAGSRNCLRVLANGNQVVNTIQFIETNEVTKLLGKTVTASFKIRRNTTLTQDLQFQIDKSSTVDAGIGASWNNISYVAIPNASMPTGTGSSDWLTVTLTVAVPNDGTANSLRFWLASNTIPNGGYYEIAQAQLEVGSVATPFVRAGGTLQGELAACQRYCYRVTGLQAYASGQVFGAGGTFSYLTAHHPVNMRVSPTMTYSSVGALEVLVAANTMTTTAIAQTNAGTYASQIDATHAARTAGQGATARVRSGEWIQFDSEL